MSAGRRYTLGIWMVKAGHEDEFISAWRAMAEWTLTRFEFGPWPDEATIATWRQSPEFQQHLGRIQEHVDEFVPRHI